MAISNFNITCTATDGRTIDQIAEVIKRRETLLHESTKDACIAFAIQICKSLRKETSQFKGKIKPITDKIDGTDLNIAVWERGDLIVGFMKQGGKVQPCIRQSGSLRPHKNIHPWYRCSVQELSQAHVYEFALSKDRELAWKCQLNTQRFVVGTSLGQVKNALQKRFEKVAKRYGSLGKDAWSRAMMLASQRQQQFQVGEKAKKILNGNVIVSKKLDSVSILGDSGDFEITVQDNLKFAGMAIQGGGDAAVNRAMMRATNSINGYLNNWCQKHHLLDEVTEKPFPEALFE